MRPGDHIPAGELDQLISLYSPNVSGDEITGETLTVAGVAAKKRTLRGREVEASNRDVSESWAVFSIRYRAGLDTVSVLTHGGDRWNVDAVDNVNGANRRIDITARLVR
jgi:head-tail adaptor